MPSFAPHTVLATHEVTNQPPAFQGQNLYLIDTPLREAAQREGGGWLDPALRRLGAAVGSETVLEWADQANRYPPELVSFDRYGRRLDEVRFHPAYHALMGLAMEHQIHSIAWTGPSGGHVAHAAMLALFSQAEQGTMCPISMTYASLPALRRGGTGITPWIEKILNGRYDAPLAPITEKAG